MKSELEKGLNFFREMKEIEEEKRQKKIKSEPEKGAKIWR